jgi:hypothetical protein
MAAAGAVRYETLAAAAKAVCRERHRRQLKAFAGVWFCRRLFFPAPIFADAKVLLAPIFAGAYLCGAYLCRRLILPAPVFSGAKFGRRLSLPAPIFVGA